MASMGLKVDHNAVGTDLAGQLAKALIGDPNLELEMAKAGIWADTQREQQKQLRSETAYKAAQAEAERAALTSRTNAGVAAGNYYSGELPVPVDPNPVFHAGDALPEIVEAIPTPAQPFRDNPEAPVPIALIGDDEPATVVPYDQRLASYERRKAFERANAEAVYGAGGNAEQVAAGANKLRGGFVQATETNPDVLRRNLPLLGINPTDETLLGKTDSAGTVAKIRVAEATEAAKGKAELAKPQVKEFNGGFVTLTPNGDGTYSSTPVVGAEPRPTSPYGGNSVEETHLRVIDDINRRAAAGGPISADDIRAYEVSFDDRYAPKKQVFGGTGGSPLVEYPVRQDIPEGVLTPTELRQKAGDSPAQQGPTPEGVPLSQALDPARRQTSADDVKVLVPGATQYSEQDKKNASLAIEMGPANDYLDGLGPSDIPLDFILVDTDANPFASISGMAASEDAKIMASWAETFVNGVARRDTGATVSEKELRSYALRMVPRPGDSAEVLLVKSRQRELVEKSMTYPLELAEVNSFNARLDRASKGRGVIPAETSSAPPPDVPGTPVEKAPGTAATAPVTAASSPAPAGVSQELWDRMEPEDRALWSSP